MVKNRHYIKQILLLVRQFHQTALDDADHLGGQRIVRHHSPVIIFQYLEQLGQEQCISIRILIYFIKFFRITQKFMSLRLDQLSRLLQGKPF